MNNIFKSMVKKSIVILMAIALVFGITVPAAGGGNIYKKAYAATKGLKAGDSGITIRNTNLRSLPSLKGKILLTAKKGTDLKIVASYNYWYKVKLSNGKTGYMIKTNISAALVTKSASTANTGSNGSTVKSGSTGNNDLTVDKSKVESTMILATTTSTQDSGLLDYIIPIFEKKYNTSVKVVAVGTGEAIEMGKRGDADVLLVHARTQEDAFVSSGYGINRKDVMYNEFFIVGPKDDPAKISSEKEAEVALKEIADSKAIFISRGDKSGTNTKELSLWSKYNIKPQGESWYKESGQGMGDTLMMAAELGGYTLVDSATWYAYMDKVNLRVALQGDKDLFNPYGVIEVNPEKYPNLHYNAALAFIEYLTSPDGQKDIASFVKNGHQLFTPDAK